MSRIPMIDPAAATGEAAVLLAAVQSQLGVTPNFIRVLANSAPALKGFLGLYGGTGEGALDLRTRERIALAVAEENACQYCVSAHAAIGRAAGLDDGEIAAARAGGSRDAKAAAAVAFAKALAAHGGEVTAAEFGAVREAGYTDGEIVEIIVNVALNVLTNMLGKATQVEIDFPKVALLAA
ncbi:carboxymuconolactone decarboxylase family protein [Arenibaculum sp.]|jgi:uncharacterized peroxidase-related enzyme|uniref:carboxymuconolactone decarboxylase family protein n=1 Tax=Arenibaculum sp. TaxID=2865862 RepID=UPI002E1023EA|nr:carboxymuconolactone decarboxylase family protein [Arenibaculum sp.]